MTVGMTEERTEKKTFRKKETNGLAARRKSERSIENEERSRSEDAVLSVRTK